MRASYLAVAWAGMWLARAGIDGLERLQRR